MNYYRTKETIVWNLKSDNYTHFLMDELGNAMALNGNNKEKIGYEIEPKGTHKTWKDEWKNKNVGTIEIDTSDITVIRASKLVVPVGGCLRWKIKQLKTKINDYGKEKNIRSVQKNKTKVVIIYSNTNSRERIYNLKEIMLRISCKYELVIWEPEKMDNKRKYEFLESHEKPVIIGIGSALMNCVLFEESIRGVISLVDPRTMSNRNYLHGGWAYYLTIQDKIKNIIELKIHQITNVNQISRCSYSSEQILNAIKEIEEI